jgi:para-nitrobenzyl esterase
MLAAPPAHAQPVQLGQPPQAAAPAVPAAPQPIRVDGGLIAGALPNAYGVRAYKGIPYAAPPVWNLRWREPQPVKPWQGVRGTYQSGANCIQGKLHRDINPFIPGMSEDCLYLNVWSAAQPGQYLPVFFWIHGGGYQAGSGAEPRHDGATLARKGVVVVTINYRLGVFGFLAHPELTAESPHRTSGDYAMLDMVAALQWVQRNIAQFGGDPRRVTIAGESTGSDAVSRLMASPLARGLFQRAIGESGAAFGTMPELTLAAAEANGLAFAGALGGDNLARLRQRTPSELLALETASHIEWKFTPNVDGWFLPQPVPAIFAAGQQNDVPLLAGWNRDEGVVFTDQLGDQPIRAVRENMFGRRASDAAQFYPSGSPAQEAQSRVMLAGDIIIAHPTWRWIMAQRATGHAPVYVYRFDHTPPIPPDWFGKSVTVIKTAGAFHSGEIPYVFGHPQVMPGWRITPADAALADQMSSAWAAFVTTGEPNAAGLPPWPAYNPAQPLRMIFDVPPRVEADGSLPRHQFLQSREPSLP